MVSTMKDFVLHCIAFWFVFVFFCYSIIMENFIFFLSNYLILTSTDIRCYAVDLKKSLTRKY